MDVTEVAAVASKFQSRVIKIQERGAAELPVFLTAGGPGDRLGCAINLQSYSAAPKGPNVSGKCQWRAERRLAA